MQNIKWEDYRDDSLEFVFTQAKNLIDETFTSVRQSANKSHALLLIYLAVFSFCFNKVIELKFEDAQPYLAGGFGILAAVYFAARNIMPNVMFYGGTTPKALLSEYFTQGGIRESQKREMQIVRIEGLDRAISHNLTLVGKMGDRFRNSLIIFLFSLLLGLVLSLV